MPKKYQNNNIMYVQPIVLQAYLYSRVASQKKIEKNEKNET